MEGKVGEIERGGKEGGQEREGYLLGSRVHLQAYRPLQDSLQRLCIWTTLQLRLQQIYQKLKSDN